MLADAIWAVRRRAVGSASAAVTPPLRTKTRGQVVQRKRRVRVRPTWLRRVLGTHRVRQTGQCGGVLTPQTPAELRQRQALCWMDGCPACREPVHTVLCAMAHVQGTARQSSNSDEMDARRAGRFHMRSSSAPIVLPKRWTRCRRRRAALLRRRSTCGKRALTLSAFPWVASSCRRGARESRARWRRTVRPPAPSTPPASSC